MAIVTTDSMHYTNIANAIRETTGSGKTYLPEEMDEGVHAAYDAGVADHFESYYKRCNIQKNYVFAFAGMGWNNKDHDIYGMATYIPTEDMTFDCSVNSASMYANSNVTDTVAAIDLSKATNNVSSTFANATKLVTIRKLIVSETTPAIGFTSCSKLANITFEGVIAKKLNLQWCPLSVASMKNIISCLKNFTGTGKENTVAVTFKDTCWEALEADSTAPNGGTWKDYVMTVLCWNV